MFTAQQVIDIRRFCGYPVYGSQVNATYFGYRYYYQDLQLQYRIDNLTSTEETTVINIYLANLNTLEAAIPASSQNLDTDTAAVWKHNAKEVQDRVRLFNYWQKRLMEFFGVPSPSPLTSNTFCMVV